jgi:hypothetical protein
MDRCKSFKHPAELREYWRLEKRRQRVHERVSKEVKADQMRKLEANERNYV